MQSGRTKDSPAMRHRGFMRLIRADVSSWGTKRRSCASELNCMEADACSNQAKRIAAEDARLFPRKARSYKTIAEW